MLDPFDSTLIFGREPQLQRLSEAYGRVRQTGYGEIVLIGGPAGLGKTALVRRFLERDSSIRAVSGKADEALRHLPYRAALSALSGLLSSAELAELAQMQDAAMANAAPRIQARLLGSIAANTSAQHPLVLFLDDLHWFDNGSLRIVRALSQQGMRDLLLIGTYRTSQTENFRDTTLATLLAESTATVTDITLDTLDRDATEALTLSRLGRQTGKPLARLIASITDGNPFHINLILSALARGAQPGGGRDRTIGHPGALAVSGPETSGWDLASLLDAALAGLTAETRRALQLAACLGFSCERSILEAALEGNRALAGALDSGLLQADAGTCRFQHDAVREHVLRGLLQAERAALHGQLARVMQSRGENSSAAKLALAEQIVGVGGNPDLLADTGRALDALIAAARMVKAAGSPGGAIRYAEAGLALAGQMPGMSHHHWTLAELRCAALAEIHGAAIEDADLDRLARLAATPLEHARSIRLKAAVMILRGQFSGAIELALAGLACLDIRLSRTPSQSETDAALRAVQEALKSLPLHAIARAPRLTDATTVVAMDLLATLQSAMFSNDGLRFLHVAKIVELSARHGVCEATCYGLAWCGVLMAGEHGDPETAFAMAEAAVALSQSHGFLSYRTSALVALDQVSVWVRPMSFALSRARDAFDHGKKSGDISMACYAANHVVSDLLTMGAPLAYVGTEIARGLSLARTLGFEDVIRILRLQESFVEALQSEELDVSAMLAEAEAQTASEMSPLVFWGYLFAGIAAFHHGRLTPAARYLRAARAWAWSTPAHIHIADLHFYSALCARMLGQIPGDCADRAAIAAFARQNPLTFASKLAFIDAETARRQGRMIEALRCYDRAIRTGTEAGLKHETALACERAGRLACDLGLVTPASEYLSRAHADYQRWGGTRHCARLERDFAALLKQPPAPEENAIAETAGLTLQGAKMDQMVATAARYCGALRGQLVSLQGAEPDVVAEATLVPAGPECDLPQAGTDPVPPGSMLPGSILRLVQQTAEPLRYGNAVIEAGKEHLASLGERPVRSLLCVPLKQRDHVFSILCLENDRVTDAFSHETERALELFAAATTEVLVLDARLQRQQQNRDDQQRRDTALLAARTDLVKNSQVTVLGSMAASIVHEVNQPLAAIATYAHSGMRWLRRAEPDLDQASDSFAQIEEASLRASGIIQALRSLAKQAPAKLEFLELAVLVSHVLGLVATDARAEGVEIEYTPSDAACIFADPVQIEQVILNLLTNALDAVHGLSGPRKLTITTTIRDEIVVLAVHDTGTGIPAGKRDQVFAPFFTTKASGLGMGLAICSTIAEVHGGGLSIGSTGPAGTTMLLRLPQATRAPEDPA